MKNIATYWHLLLDYYHIFHEYISIWELIKPILLFTFLFLISGISLVFFCKKWLLVERKYPIWKWITYSYFVLIPIWIGFSGAKFGLLQGLQKECKHATTKIMGDADFKIDSTIAKNIIVANATPNQLIDLYTYYYFDLYKIQLNDISTKQTGVKQKLAKILLVGIQSKILSELLKFVIKDNLDKYLHIDKNVSNEILSTKFKEYAENGLFTKIIHIQIDATFRGLKKSTILLMFLILLIPVIEICIAYYLLNKMQQANTTNETEINNTFNNLE